MDKIDRNYNVKINQSDNWFSAVYYIANIIIAFKIYGFGWGLVSFIIPIFPFIYLAQIIH